MNEVGSDQYKSPEEEAAAREFENREQQSLIEKEKKPQFDAAIVLGARLDEKSSIYNLPENAQVRVMAAAEMIKKGLVREIIFTGGKTNSTIDASEAERMRDYLKELLAQDGMKAEQIEQVEQMVTLEDKAIETIENIANVCNIVDQSPEKYQHLAVLTNEYHVPRAEQLTKNLILEAEGISAEKVISQNSSKRQEILDRVIASADDASKLAVERRASEGLKHGEKGGIPRYWFPKAMAVENPDRLFQIMASLYGPAFAQKVGREALLKQRETLRNIKRVIPPEEWGRAEPNNNKER